MYIRRYVGMDIGSKVLEALKSGRPHYHLRLDAVVNENLNVFIVIPSVSTLQETNNTI